MKPSFVETPSYTSPANTQRWQHRWRFTNTAMSLVFVSMVLILRPNHTMAQQSKDDSIYQQTIKGFSSRRRAIGYKMSYYANPKLLWKSQIGNRTVDTDNVIEQSPFDENFLYATTHEAYLSVLSASDGQVVASIEPSSVSFDSDRVSVEWTTTCKSGVSFGELEPGKRFLVYSVVDRPPEGSDHIVETRIIAVSIPGHEELWSSHGLSGETMGSPVVYQTRDRQNFIALTHNNDMQMDDKSIVNTGHITLLRADNGHVVWTESEWRPDTLPKGYGPPGIASSPIAGMYRGGERNQNDLVVWANNNQNGRGVLGETFAFQLPDGFRSTENDASNLGAVALKTVRWTSISRPIFGADGSSMYIGVTGDQLRGWTGDTPFDEPADWSLELSDDGADDITAVPVAPTLSNDGQRLFISTSSSGFHCVDAQTGDRMWKLSGASTFQTGARVSPDDQMVYFIQSIDGRLYAYDQHRGVLRWLTSCDAFEEDCADSVRASFALSQTGEYLYYADVLGRVIALKLGDLVEESGDDLVDDVPGPPGIFQTSDGKSPGEKGSAKSLDPQRGPSDASSIALIILALLLAFGSGTYIALVRKDVISRPRKGRLNRRNIHGGARVGDEFLVPGPDPYEDSIICKHHIHYTDARNIWLGDAGEINSYPLDGRVFDRRFMILGLSNNVAPLT